jgi:hypothetical protein
MHRCAFADQMWRAQSIQSILSAATLRYFERKGAAMMSEESTDEACQSQDALDLAIEVRDCLLRSSWDWRQKYVRGGDEATLGDAQVFVCACIRSKKPPGSNTLRNDYDERIKAKIRQNGQLEHSAMLYKAGETLADLAKVPASSRSAFIRNRLSTIEAIRVLVWCMNEDLDDLRPWMSTDLPWFFL